MRPWNGGGAVTARAEERRGRRGVGGAGKADGGERGSHGRSLEEELPSPFTCYKGNKANRSPSPQMLRGRSRYFLNFGFYYLFIYFYLFKFFYY